MDEHDKPNPADKILGADWKPPLRDLQERSWAQLEQSERDRLAVLQREGWRERWQDDAGEGESVAEAFIQLELYSPDQDDPRPAEPIGHPWPYKMVIDENNRARAIVDEHGEI